ncbi:MAG: hypothetical protein E6I38_09760 [Chloroflexi bacterium]|nr:MAG: hypothetical protein E6I38_09760 [Chloroflexota bacterium]
MALVGVAFDIRCRVCVYVTVRSAARFDIATCLSRIIRVGVLVLVVRLAIRFVVYVTAGPIRIFSVGVVALAGVLLTVRVVVGRYVSFLRVGVPLASIFAVAALLVGVLVGVFAIATPLVSLLAGPARVVRIAFAGVIAVEIADA